ncbi:hypothetical protein OVA29_18255 [Exiguobacterium sp. SL14]|nr:hypothetical protein [Exiguobacterium sp. SL14]MCY1692273.1 hypothetical protein [Exiguobacterium sp. SL14]
MTGLLIYRLVYYLIPFLIGVVFSAREFSGPVVKMIEDKPIVGPSFEVGGVIWRLQLRFLSKIRHFTLALITLVVGITIWGLAILPRSRRNMNIWNRNYHTKRCCSRIVSF